MNLVALAAVPLLIALSLAGRIACDRWLTDEFNTATTPERGGEGV